MTTISLHRMTNLAASVAAVALTATLAACAILGGVMLTHSNLSSAAFGGLIALFIAGITLGFVAWLLGLMRAAQSRQWDWLIAVLLLGAAGTLLYTIAGSRAEAAM
ncbi:MAG: hypothetical protein ACXVDF_23115 [Ktedonobacterales bacterium]